MKKLILSFLRDRWNEFFCKENSMNIQKKEFETEIKVIYGVLAIDDNEKIGLESLEDIFFYRLAGILLQLSNIAAVDLETDLKEILKKIERLNSIRNSTIVREIEKIDGLLVNNNVDHLWIKGIRDVLNDKTQMGLRECYNGWTFVFF